MEKWNKRIGMAVFGLGLLAMTPNVTEAADCYSCDPCEPVVDQCCNDSCFGGIDFGVDFLLWKPAVADLDWSASYFKEAVPGTGFSPAGDEIFVKYHDLCPGWEPGFRLRLSKEDCWCDWRLELDYTRVKSKAHDRVNNCSECSELEGTRVVLAPPVYGGEVFTGNPLQFGAGKWESTYQSWDVLFAYDLDCCRCHVFTPYFGIAGLNLDQKVEAFYANTLGVIQNSVQFRWQDSFFGVGLKVGTDYSYNLCDCLKIFAGASCSLIAGDDDARNSQTFWSSDTEPTFVNIRWKDDDCTRILPGWHLQLGLLYESCYCGTEWGFRIGWEFLKWHNVQNHRTFVSDPTNLSGSSATLATFPTNGANLSSSTSPNTRTYGFHGLLAGLEVHF